ncbi:hypothetical protein K6119_16390 [Paracrocinitomix mangrovi]|uniref:hypothetical protein n=1 Tax=Paracrocinitomix mangrovi TaxID=2862509 RepID=UPI001C8DCE84|nr:hypothetical protein [Paracrocinitomix mangrovi]UKN01308.1 hypothetical protein K6119_16390 [Paracrocinitomix mangrovi]
MKAQNYLSIILIFSLIGCDKNEETVSKNIPSASNNVSISPEPVKDNYIDSLLSIEYPKTPEGEREKIFNQWVIDNSPNYPTSDSVFDINYDGIADYVINFYYMCGNGLKNGWEVYISKPELNGFYRDTVLSEIVNPSYYPNQKKITGFYIPYGRGYCEEYHFDERHNLWKKKKEVKVTNNGKNSIWDIHYLNSDQHLAVFHPYQGIPPSNIIWSKHNTEYYQEKVYKEYPLK